MKFFYGDKNILRALDEAEFWKHQESEHTDVIMEIVPDLENEYVEKLEQYKRIFDSTHDRAVQYSEAAVNCCNILPGEMYENIVNLVDLSIKQSKVFVEFLGMLLSDSEAVKGNPAAVTVLNHMRRESEYFIGAATAYLNEGCSGNYERSPGFGNIM